MASDKADEMLSVYMTDRRVRTLGPGLRYVIWVQGCPLACRGCLVPNSHSADDGAVVSLATLSHEILSDPDIEGVTLSGGEPFSQAAALASLISDVRSKRDLGVIVYTGYQQRELIKEILFNPDGGWARLYSQIDLLIDGRFVESLNDDRPLRGSSNQEVIPLSPRYATELIAYGDPTLRRSVKITQTSGELRVVGVPSRDLLTSLADRGLLLDQR